MTLAQVGRETRRLAQYAPPTALALNMHNYWVGIAADLWRAGDKSIEWILREAADGEVFAAGHAEHGNDIPVLLSTTKAERVDGGYKFTGRKALRQPDAGVDAPWRARDGRERSKRHRRSCTRSCRAIQRDTPSKRRGTCSACGPHAATTRSSRARSSPTSTSRGSSRPAQRASITSSLASSRGHWSVSPTCTTGWRSESAKSSSSS